MDNAQDTRPQYLSLAQASAICGLSTRTLRRAIAARELDAHYVRSRVRIKHSELERWVESDGATPSVSKRQPLRRNPGR